MLKTTGARTLVKRLTIVFLVVSAAVVVNPLNPLVMISRFQPYVFMHYTVTMRASAIVICVKSYKRSR